MTRNILVGIVQILLGALNLGGAYAVYRLLLMARGKRDE